MINRPPFEVGAANATKAEVPDNVTVEMDGAPGTSGITALSVTEADCPIAFTARTVALKDCPGFKPVTVHIVDKAVANVHVPEDGDTTYDVSGEPPSVRGDFHEIVATRPLTLSMVTSCGADGACNGKTVAAAVFDATAAIRVVVMVTIFTKYVLVFSNPVNVYSLDCDVS